MSQKNTIFVEDAEIISHVAYDAQQYVLRVRSPQIAQRARPGSFAHLTCSAELPMRRPLSIMLTNGDEVDFLYKAVGEGTRRLAQRKVGEVISVMGPVGVPFTVSGQRPRALLLGGGVGIPPMVFLAKSLVSNKKAHAGKADVFRPFVIMGSEVPFPFKCQPSTIVVPGMPEGVIGTMPILEDWGIPCRLTSKQGYPGCYDGYVTDLARAWLQSLTTEQLAEVEIFSCGPHPMLASIAALAREFDVPCQVSLEEFMACAVGGCAGCVVEVNDDSGKSMKRVCVDGPVFDARHVF